MLQVLIENMATTVSMIVDIVKIIAWNLLVIVRMAVKMAMKGLYVLHVSAQIVYKFWNGINTNIYYHCVYFLVLYPILKTAPTFVSSTLSNITVRLDNIGTEGKQPAVKFQIQYTVIHWTEIIIGIILIVFLHFRLIRKSPGLTTVNDELLNH